MVICGEVVIEVALNGGRDRAENKAVPFTADELAAEARRCADVGVTVFHVHARADDGGWTADPSRCAEVVRGLRDAIPHGLVSITSIRLERVGVEEILELLAVLGADPATRPDLISVNLGHIVAWDPMTSGPVRRRTIHFPNAYDDSTRLLSACAVHGIRPELGVGFVSNTVTLRDDGRLLERPWFLIELDSPAYGAGVQVSPSTAENYDAHVAAMGEYFPASRWAVHGQGMAGYAVMERALADGSHIRVGFEDTIHLPDGRLAPSNAELVAWAVDAARGVGRAPAMFEEARVITGCNWPTQASPAFACGVADGTL